MANNNKGNSYLETVFGKIKNKFSEMLRNATRSSLNQAQNLFRQLQGFLAGQSNIRPSSIDNVADAFAEAAPEMQVSTAQRFLRANTDRQNYSYTGPVYAGNQIFQDNVNRLYNRLDPKFIGRMSMFFYDPEFGKELPYFDRFPLVIPIKFYGNGFLGLNLHYLPHRQRAWLLDILYQIFYHSDHLDENKRLQISYELLKSRSRTRLYLPCIKRYKYKQFRSKILVLKPDDWLIALFSPLERFEKRSMRFVHQESLKIVQDL